MTRDKEGYFIMTKGQCLHQEDIKVLKVCAPQNKAPKYVK